MSNVLRRGDIVFATMLDPQGANPKTRPVLIVEVDPSKINCFTVIAITSTFENVLGPNQVNLPFSNSIPPARTGLRVASRADVDWFTYDDLKDAKRVGYVTSVLFARILKLFIDRLKDRSSLG